MLKNSFKLNIWPDKLSRINHYPDSQSNGNIKASNVVICRICAGARKLPVLP